MRDIKFEYGFESVNGIVKKVYHISEIPRISHRCDVWNVLPLCYVRQYTGLKDKNGKGNEVFEGDLFECVFSNIPNGFSSLNTKEVRTTQIATVIYKMGMFQIRVFHPDYDEYVSYPLHEFLKNEQKVVIGNLHQNPELLKA